MNSEKAGSIRCVGPACCVSEEGMDESYAKANTVGEKHLMSALSMPA